MARSPYAIYVAMLIARMYNVRNSYLGNSPKRPDPHFMTLILVTV
jgi:hypothetical protein